MSTTESQVDSLFKAALDNLSPGELMELEIKLREHNGAGIEKYLVENESSGGNSQRIHVRAEDVQDGVEYAQQVYDSLSSDQQIDFCLSRNLNHPDSFTAFMEELNARPGEAADGNFRLAVEEIEIVEKPPIPLDQVMPVDDEFDFVNPQPADEKTGGEQIKQEPGEMLDRILPILYRYAEQPEDVQADINEYLKAKAMPIYETIRREGMDGGVAELMEREPDTPRIGFLPFSDKRQHKA